MKKYKYRTLSAIGHRRTPNFFSINVGAVLWAVLWAVFMAKKNLDASGWVCVGAPMANFV